MGFSAKMVNINDEKRKERGGAFPYAIDSLGGKNQEICKTTAGTRPFESVVVHTCPNAMWTALQGGGSEREGTDA